MRAITIIKSSQDLLNMSQHKPIAHEAKASEPPHNPHISTDPFFFFIIEHDVVVIRFY
jgi:hypothetical protein